MSLESKIKYIETLEKSLKVYKTLLKSNRNSLFYNGLVKNTQEYIEELKSDLNENKRR